MEATICVWKALYDQIIFLFWLCLVLLSSQSVKLFPSGDVREHRKLCMDKKMDQFDWERFTISDDPSENVRPLSETLLLMFNELNAFQLLRLEFHPEIRLTCLLLLNICTCKIRNKNSRSQRQSENLVLQERINALLRAEQIRAVNERKSSYHTSSKRWWDTG